MENNTNAAYVGDNTSGDNISCWLSSINTGRQFYPLIVDVETEVVIVGGGLAGVSVAYNLSKRGIPVVLLEDGLIASGETGRTTAHLSSALDDRFYNLIKLFGKEDAHLIWESHNEAINFIEKTISEENIDCDFKRVDGYLFPHPSDSLENLEKEFDAARELGIPVEFADQVPGLKLQPLKAIRFVEQGQFHPVKYILGLVHAINANGGKIYTGTHVNNIDEKGVSTSDGFRVNAKHIVVATNSPINSRFILPLTQYPYRTYAIAALIRKDSLPAVLWWDTGDFNVDKDLPPYHYVRTQPYNSEYDLLIAGGEDHKTGMMGNESELDRYGKIEGWVRDRFDVGEVIFRWSGQVMEPYDKIAFIGHSAAGKSNIYIAAGDSGHGMTHATIAGILLTDIIMGNENPWQHIYKPGRLNLKASKLLFKETIGTLLKYYKTNPDHPGSVSLASIGLNDAEIVEFNGQKAGAYRDEHGMLHLVAAHCTHLGCIVRWNNVEKTWDCPCHGSRFSITGQVINGPANDSLEILDEDTQL